MLIALTLLVAFGCFAGCGNDSADPPATGTIEITQRLPNGPIAFHGTSTGVQLTDAEGREVFSKDVWDLRGRSVEESEDIAAYDFATATLERGSYQVAAVFRSCPRLGCSEGHVGAGFSKCAGRVTVRPDEQTNLVVTLPDSRSVPCRITN